MGPYTHILIAKMVAPNLQPIDQEAYLWGAVAPDTRYLVPGMDRSQTHISSELLKAYADRYPQLRDFLLGYGVHLATDSIDLPGLLQRKFPFNLRKGKLPAHAASTLLEFYNLRKPFSVPPTLSAESNPILSEQGIPTRISDLFADNLVAYLSNPSYQAVLAVFMVPGIETNPRVAKYQAAAQRFERSWLLQRLVYWGLTAARINSEIATGVRTLLSSAPFSLS
jgi:hypothetical protein